LLPVAPQSQSRSIPFLDPAKHSRR
jgi:hypothetical protein